MFKYADLRESDIILVMSDSLLKKIFRWLSQAKYDTIYELKYAGETLMLDGKYSITNIYNKHICVIRPIFEQRIIVYEGIYQ